MIFILPALQILFIHILISGVEAVLPSIVELYLWDRAYCLKIVILLKLKSGPVNMNLAMYLLHENKSSEEHKA